jgi:hypothetical protein
MESERMKRYGYICIGLLVLVLQGCKSPDKMEGFIPTPTLAPAPAGSMGEITSNKQGTDEISDVIPEDGETVTKYVSLTKYGASLNVRSAPSKDGKIVGKLMHMEKIDVISIKDGWACYKDEEEVRYVNADYLVDELPKTLDPDD